MPGWIRVKWLSWLKQPITKQVPDFTLWTNGLGTFLGIIAIQEKYRFNSWCIHARKSHIYGIWGPRLKRTPRTQFWSFSNFWPRLVDHRLWYTIQEYLPDDVKPIGTHLGPKEWTDKLFFLSGINFQSWVPTHYNGQLWFAHTNRNIFAA